MNKFNCEHRKINTGFNKALRAKSISSNRARSHKGFRHLKIRFENESHKKPYFRRYWIKDDNNLIYITEEYEVGGSNE